MSDKRFVRSLEREREEGERERGRERLSSVEDNTGVGDNCSRPETAKDRERGGERPTRLTAV